MCILPSAQVISDVVEATVGELVVVGGEGVGAGSTQLGACGIPPPPKTPSQTC